MKRRFILYRRKRGGMFYVEDTGTHKQESTGTRNRAEATALLNARNESVRQPQLNLQIAKAYLVAMFRLLGDVLSLNLRQRRKLNLRPFRQQTGAQSWVYGFTISVRYLGRSARIFFIVAAWAAGLGLGAGIVRPVTGIPTARKNSSCPAGEQMQSNRAGCWEALVKKCGALAGMLTLSPARMIDFLPRKVASISPSRTVKDSSKSWRWGGGPPPCGTCMSMRQ